MRPTFFSNSAPQLAAPFARINRCGAPQDRRGSVPRTRPTRARIR